MDQAITIGRVAIAGMPSDDEEIAEALRRRIEVYCHHLHAGVPGLRAIGYLRQIAEDEDSLAELTSD